MIKFAGLLRPLILIIIASLLFASCKDSYNYVSRKGTLPKKYEYAVKYFKKKKYSKALPLLEEIYKSYKGKKEAEDIYYMLAMSHYKLKDFLLASYYFGDFTQSYSLSPRVEECSYLHCICEFNKSLPAYLDQGITTNAITEFQIFINNFPDSKYMAECNNYIDILRSKLHKKAYQNAMLYYETENYKAASVAFQNAINDFPDLPQKDEFEFLIIKSLSQYADKSILYLRPERYQKALDAIAEYYADHNQERGIYYNQVFTLEKEIKVKNSKAQEEIKRKPNLVPKEVETVIN